MNAGSSYPSSHLVCLFQVARGSRGWRKRSACLAARRRLCGRMRRERCAVSIGRKLRWAPFSPLARARLTRFRSLRLAFVWMARLDAPGVPGFQQPVGLPHLRRRPVRLPPERPHQIPLQEHAPCVCVGHRCEHGTRSTLMCPGRRLLGRSLEQRGRRRSRRLSRRSHAPAGHHRRGVLGVRCRGAISAVRGGSARTRADEARTTVPLIPPATRCVSTCSRGNNRRRYVARTPWIGRLRRSIAHVPVFPCDRSRSTETQQVWDFAGDGFVHRLIHNKADGKLVEIPDPGQTSEERPQVPARLSDVQVSATTARVCRRRAGVPLDFFSGVPRRAGLGISPMVDRGNPRRVKRGSHVDERCRILCRLPCVRVARTPFIRAVCGDPNSVGLTGWSTVEPLAGSHEAPVGLRHGSVLFIPRASAWRRTCFQVVPLLMQRPPLPHNVKGPASGFL